MWFVYCSMWDDIEIYVTEEAMIERIEELQRMDLQNNYAVCGVITGGCGSLERAQKAAILG